MRLKTNNKKEEIFFEGIRSLKKESQVTFPGTYDRRETILWLE